MLIKCEIPLQNDAEIQADGRLGFLSLSRDLEEFGRWVSVKIDDNIVEVQLSALKEAVDRLS